jgi:hypothetical protein
MVSGTYGLRRKNIPSICIAVVFDECLLSKLHLLVDGQAIVTEEVGAQSKDIIMSEGEWKISEIGEACSCKDFVQPERECC